MNLTKEQMDIVSTSLEVGESLIVEAGAGTGKTTCFIEYAKSRPSAKILYLCFNNKAAKEAQTKYAAQKVTNTHTSTIHGLATQIKKRYELSKKFATRVSIKNIEKRFGYSPKLAWLILETIKNYCYSSDAAIQKDHTPNLIDKELDATNTLIKESQRVWQKIIDLKDPMPISYDHYLKLFQLSNPILNYDYILLDEAQDSNPLTLSILAAQRHKTRTVLIGDENQAIYGWRGAKNAMRQWENSKKLKLTESFRFGKTIAELANCVLKAHPYNNPRINGSNKPDAICFKPKDTDKNTTFIARTNATLFEKAVELQQKGLKCHFVNTEEKENWDPSRAYKLNDLKDIYRLWSGNINTIENPLIKMFKNYHELRKLAHGNKTQNMESGSSRPTQIGTDNKAMNFEGDKELEFLCRMVEKYKHSLPNIVKTIKEQASGPPKSKEDKIVTLCTAHRAKGLEWDNVELADDFLEIDKPADTQINTVNTQTDPKDLNLENDFPQDYIEEVNLLYVACTRAKHNLYTNDDLSKVCTKNDIKIFPEGLVQAENPNIDKLAKPYLINGKNIPLKNSPSNDTLYLTM